MEFSGRIDKKFCCDQCRNTFNNKQNQDTNNFTRQINRILTTNRRILRELFDRNEKKLSKEKLLKAGFNPDYMTNIYTTSTGNIYYFCYDIGYIITDNEKYTIVERGDYVN